MTRNQRLVLVWCQEHCSALGIVKVSNTEIGLIFGWSQQYTQKILRNLVDGEHLEILQKGIGRRPTKYRVTSVRGNKKGSSHNQNRSLQQVHSHNLFRVVPFRYTKTPRNNIGDNAYPYKRRLFDNVDHPIKRVSTKGSPFKRFRTHYDSVRQWNATDFVCYYSFVYRVRWGESPDLNWPTECGSARTLMKRLKHPEKVKAFIQVAFGMYKRKPIGLRSFVHDWFYEQVVAADDDYIESFLDEYDDEYVFPWLKQELIRRSSIAADEYQKNLVLRGLGIYK